MDTILEQIKYLKNNGYEELMCDIEDEYANITPIAQSIVRELVRGLYLECCEAIGFRDCYNECLEDIICKIEEMKCEGEDEYENRCR